MQFQTDQLIAFGKQHSLPDYIKTAKTSAFADIDDPKTKVAVYLRKFAELLEKKPKNRELEKRAEILGISEDLEKLAADFADSQKPKVEKVATTNEQYPIRNPEELKAAISWLQKNAYAISLPDRRELAEKIIKKCAEYKVTPTDTVYKYAGIGVPDKAVLYDNLMKRAALLRVTHKIHPTTIKEATAADLEKLAQESFKKAEYTAAELDEIAGTLQFIDNEYGLHSKYGSYINHPDQVCYAISLRSIEEAEKYAYQINNDVYDIREFEALKIADIADVLGEDFVEVMSEGLYLNQEKIAKVLEVMTDLEKELFTGLIKEAGIKPKYQVKETVDLKALTKELSVRA